MTPDPAALQAKLQEGYACHQRGQAADARRLYDDVLTQAPQSFEALYLAGVLAAQTGDFERAVELMGRAVAVNPGHAGAHYNLATALSAQKRYAAALPSYDQALALDPTHTGAHHNRALVLLDLKRFAEAVAAFDKVLAAQPHAFEDHVGRGRALAALRRHQDALESFAAAIRLKPDSAALHIHHGAALIELQRMDEAIASYDRAIALKPESAEAHNDRAVALAALGRTEEAVIGYRGALRLRPDLADAHNNLANALIELKRYEEAIAAYDEALAVNPDHAYAHGARLYARMFICQWTPFDQELEALAAKLARGEKAAQPLPAVTLAADPALQRKAAEIWARHRHPANTHLGPVAKRDFRRGDKIRVGYFSADFCNHPVALLLAGVIEEHDRERFEVHAFSLGPDKRDDMRTRLEMAFDTFIDVRGTSDGDVAALARAKGIDIAVDLSGYTGGARTNIFAHRAAPLQVNYLGYPGTMGADYMDYIIGDDTIIPAEHRAHYTEKVVWLPNSYQPNDAKRKVAARAPTRRDQGLPEEGVVFCSFNNNHKITPLIFDTWAEILKNVPGSVLWLFKDNPTAGENLRRDIARRGVDPSRLIFALRTTFPAHMARHQLADLFLDTLPFNAHTTCSDALWAGVPVLTCMGEGFAGRVAASILKAVGLPELITANVQAYRDLAIALGNDSARLAALKEKLAGNRYTMPLFDAAGFARHLEDAYVQMHKRYREGRAPDHIVVPR